MTKPSVIILENDVSFALELKMMLEKADFSVLGKFSSCESLADYSGPSPDVILADIYLDGPTKGYEIIEEWQAKGVPVVLLTSSKDRETYLQARPKLASGYLIKPVEQLTLESTIERALLLNNHVETIRDVLSSIRHEDILDQAIFVRHNRGLARVDIKSIEFIEADGNYCYIYVEGRKMVVKKSLKSIFLTLSTRGFLQVSRKAMVNILFVESVNFRDEFVLIGKKKVTIGNAYRKSVELAINKL